MLKRMTKNPESAFLLSGASDAAGGAWPIELENAGRFFIRARPAVNNAQTGQIAWSERAGGVDRESVSRRRGPEHGQNRNGINNRSSGALRFNRYR